MLDYTVVKGKVCDRNKQAISARAIVEHLNQQQAEIERLRRPNERGDCPACGGPASNATPGAEMVSTALTEIERLLEAIYMHGEAPMEQRIQIDPVQYMTTRYVPVHQFNDAIDQLNKAREAARKMDAALPAGQRLWFEAEYPWLEEE